MVCGIHGITNRPAARRWSTKCYKLKHNPTKEEMWFWCPPKNGGVDRKRQRKWIALRNCLATGHQQLLRNCHLSAMIFIETRGTHYVPSFALA